MVRVGNQLNIDFVLDELLERIVDEFFSSNTLRKHIPVPAVSLERLPQNLESDEIFA